MITLAVISLKGGVGKTSVTTGLASAARQAGLRTLVVDLDPQGDATMALDIQGEVGSTLSDVVASPRRRTMRACTVPSGWNSLDGAGDLGEVHVAVGGEDLLREDSPDLKAKRLSALGDILGKLGDDGEVDLVLVDCPPSMGGLTRMALAAADLALVVTEPGIFSVSAAERAFAAVSQVRDELNPRLRPLGILLNRVRGHIAEQRYRTEEMRSLFGSMVLETEIPDRTALQRAQGAFVPIHSVRDAGGREVAGLLDELLAHARQATTRRGT